MVELWMIHVAALVITATAAITDLRTGHIPNWITLPVIVLAPLGHLLLSSVPGLAFSLTGMFVVGVVPLVMFFRNAMGGGDVKLFAAVGALVGPGLALEVQLSSFVVAALFALGMMAYRGTLLRTLGNVAIIIAKPILPKHFERQMSPELTSPFRLGLAIFIGTVIAVIASRNGGLL